MQPAVRPGPVKPPRLSWRDWIARNTALAVGIFLCTIFILVGLIGTLSFYPTMETWHSAADWPTTEAEISGAQLQYGRRSRGARPEFTFNYEWQGQAYTAKGYDLIGAYIRGTAGGPHDVIKAHPVGSRVQVFVNPARPTQAVLTRGHYGAVIVLFVPPFFLVLGLIGAFFTTIAGLGWLDEKTRNPLGRAIRAAFGWFIQEKVIKPFFFIVVGGIVVAVAVFGIKEEQYLLVGLAGFIVWATWKAARPRKGSRATSSGQTGRR